LALRNGRAVEAPRATPVPGFEDLKNPFLFHNPQIRFVLWQAETCPMDRCHQRDMYFQFTETGGFTSMEIGLSPIPVIVGSIRFVRGIDQLALPDSVSQGLGLFDIGALTANGTRWLF
jgi:hypothetical protein